MANPPDSTQNERLAVIEKQLDNVVNLLNVELRHLRENAERDRKEFSADITHIKEGVAARPTKSEVDLMRGESERRWTDQKKWNWTFLGIAASNVSALVFFLLKHIVA